MEAVLEILIRNRIRSLNDSIDWTAKRILQLQTDIDEQKQLQVMFEGEKQSLQNALGDAGKVVDDAPVSS